MKKLISCIVVITLLLSFITPTIVKAENILEETNKQIDNAKTEEKEEIEEKSSEAEKEEDEQVKESEDEIIEENNKENNEVQKDKNEKEEIKDETENKVEEVEKQPENQILEQKAQLAVKYRAHVQDIGWQEYVQNGKEAGTTGKNLKVEALNIELINNEQNINIKYESYIQGSGWQKIASNGEQTGTTGKNLRMEAIKIWLENTEEYSIMYRAHVQDIGWQDWVYDGDIAGRLCDGLKIEAMQIQIVPKHQNTEMTVNYSSHVQDIGWQSEKQQYDISGTIGKNLKIEAMKISLKNAPKGVSIKYKACVEKSGWQSWVTDGEEAGTTGKNLRMYGIRIMLEGTDEYSIQYRAHVQDLGWQPWVENGAIAGKISYNLKIEAIQIRIVKKHNNNSKDLGVEYYTYIEGVSSNEDKIETSGQISGTTGQNRRIEGMNIELVNAPEGAHIKYQAHVQDYGWMDWVQDGQLAGVLNRGLKIEAVRIKLEGLEGYTVQYKAHVQDIGWTDWYIDGESAGTTGRNLKIEALQIKIVPEYKRYYKGIDVSYHQGTIDFDALAKSKEIDYIIPRIGWYKESQKVLVVDAQFERNYKEARAKKIPVGAYIYSYATSVAEAQREADAVVEYLQKTNQKKFELPIFYDIEHSSQQSLGKQVTAQMAITFCETLKKAGYSVGVYSYEYFFKDSLDLTMLPEDYSIWIANYNYSKSGNMPEDIYKFSKNNDIWQYTSEGKVTGISGFVDRSVSYTKYF